ncbi:hypothetical protein [Cupriavidus sp. CP313]
MTSPKALLGTLLPLKISNPAAAHAAVLPVSTDTLRQPRRSSLATA